MVIKLCVEQLWSEIILVISTQNRPELCNCQTKYNVTFIYQWKKEQNINKSEMKVKLSKNTFITKLYKSVRSDWLICSLHLPAGCMLTQGLLALFFFLYTKWKMFESLNATKEMVSVQRATIELWCTREVATHERSVRVARGERDRQQYRGARRYGISLQVFNSIAHEWAQRTSEMSSWTRKRNFISTSNHVLLCLSHKRNSPLLTREVHIINEWK